MISASEADLERYASHHRHAILRWLLQHPHRRDYDHVADKSSADWNHYLRHIRPMLGWTVLVGRKQAESA